MKKYKGTLITYENGVSEGEIIIKHINNYQDIITKIIKSLCGRKRKLQYEVHTKVIDIEEGEEDA